jgi:hypothetical protein
MKVEASMKIQPEQNTRPDPDPVSKSWLLLVMRGPEFESDESSQAASVKAELYAQARLSNRAGQTHLRPI